MRGYNIDNYISQKFNKLTLVKNLNKIDKNNSKLALFQCECGNTKEMVFTQVLNGEVKSCGCILKGQKSILNTDELKRNRLLFNIEKTQKNNTSGHTRNH